MTDDTNEADDETATTGLGEAMEFASEMAAEEVDSFEGDVPNHAAGLIAGRATDLVQTVTNIEMAQASEQAPDPEAEDIEGAIAEDAVDILLAIGTLKYEYGIDIAEAFRERQQLIEDYKAFEEAIEDAESQEDVMEAMDEHMTEELQSMLGGQMGGMMGGGMGGGIEAGTNVDSEEYDHEETDKSFA